MMIYCAFALCFPACCWLYTLNDAIFCIRSRIVLSGHTYFLCNCMVGLFPPISLLVKMDCLPSNFELFLALCC